MINIPNLFTLANLLFGCAALLFLFTGEFMAVLYCLMGSAIADVFDGMIARMMNIKSELGKELDSIADMVSFGVVPGAILYVLLLAGQQEGEFQSLMFSWLAFPGFLLTAFSGLRLAKFNLDTRQSDSFLGLPTPSATFFVLGLLLIHHFDSFGLKSFITQPWVIYLSIVALCILLISEIPLFSLKLKGLGWKENQLQYIFALIVIILLVFLKAAAFPLIIIVYVLIGLVRKNFNL